MHQTNTHGPRVTPQIRAPRQPERVTGIEGRPCHEMLDGRLLVSVCNHARLIVGADSVTLIRGREGHR